MTIRNDEVAFQGNKKARCQFRWRRAFLSGSAATSLAGGGASGRWY
jgi:hypothetical protein